MAQQVVRAAALKLIHLVELAQQIKAMWAVMELLTQEQTIAVVVAVELVQLVKSHQAILVATAEMELLIQFLDHL
jgi:hypothetical protein